MKLNRINRAWTGAALSLALAALLSAGPVKAQTGGNDPSSQGGYSGDTQNDRGHGFDAGWLGLLGLFGLMGRKKGVRQDERYHRTEARTMPT